MHSFDIPRTGSPGSSTSSEVERQFVADNLLAIFHISQDSFHLLQYFSYATTVLLHFTWAITSISLYFPLTSLFISAILYGYPNSISSVQSSPRASRAPSSTGGD